jgi:GST-like protein
MQWLFWQMAGLGPMLGQNHHFRQYAPERLPYAIERYVREAERLYGVLGDRLAEREFIAGAYSIADMASYPWIVPHERQGQNLGDFPHLRRWFETKRARPAVQRAYARADEINTRPTITEDARGPVQAGAAAARGRLTLQPSIRRKWLGGRKPSLGSMVRSIRCRNEPATEPSRAP